jgi:hypothetical protein
MVEGLDLSKYGLLVLVENDPIRQLVSHEKGF